MSEDTGRDYVLAVSRELYGRAVYTHKTHEKERQYWSKWAFWMNWVNISLAAATTVFAIISAVLQPLRVLITTAVLAALTTAFALWQASFDPVGKENRHRTAAKELLWIREEFLLLIERCHISTEQTAHLQSRLDSLTHELGAVYKFAPDTSPKAYADASKALKSGEFTFSDAEIDGLLPTRLRKKAP